MEVQKNNQKIKKLVYGALFVALTVAVHSARIQTPITTISFKGLPIILSGLFLGAPMGFAVGTVADIVAFIVRPSPFPFNPLFTLTSALTGAIPAIMMKVLKDEGEFKFWKVLVSIAVGQFITTVTLVPIFRVLIYKLFAQGGEAPIFTILFTKALIKQAIHVPVYSLITVAVYKPLKASKLL